MFFLYILQENGSTSLGMMFTVMEWSNWPLVPMSLGLPGGDKEPTSNAGA